MKASKARRAFYINARDIYNNFSQIIFDKIIAPRVLSPAMRDKQGFQSQSNWSFQFRISLPTFIRRLLSVDFPYHNALRRKDVTRDSNRSVSSFTTNRSTLDLPPQRIKLFWIISRGYIFGYFFGGTFNCSKMKPWDTNAGRLIVFGPTCFFL